MRAGGLPCDRTLSHTSSAAVGRHDQLAAVFARVARAADDAGLAADRRFGAGVVAQAARSASDERLDDIAAPAALARRSSPCRACGRSARTSSLAARCDLQPGHDLLAIAGVDDQQVIAARRCARCR